MQRTPAIRTRIRMHRSLLIVALAVLALVFGLATGRSLVVVVAGAVALYGLVSAGVLWWRGRRLGA